MMHFSRVNSSQQEDVTSPEASLLMEAESQWLMAKKKGELS